MTKPEDMTNEELVDKFADACFERECTSATPPEWSTLYDELLRRMEAAGSASPLPVPKNSRRQMCTCTGSCRGAQGLGPDWMCAMNTCGICGWHKDDGHAPSCTQISTGSVSTHGPRPEMPICPDCGALMQTGFYRVSQNSESAVKVRCRGNDLSFHQFIISNFGELRRFFAAAPAEDTKELWRCFHCDEVFTNEPDAREHFGNDMCGTAGCVNPLRSDEKARLKEVLEANDHAAKMQLECERLNDIEGMLESYRSDIGRYFGDCGGVRASTPHQAWLKLEAAQNLAEANELRAEAAEKKLAEDVQLDVEGLAREIYLETEGFTPFGKQHFKGTKADQIEIDKTAAILLRRVSGKGAQRLPDIGAVADECARLGYLLQASPAPVPATPQDCYPGMQGCVSPSLCLQAKECVYRKTEKIRNRATTQGTPEGAK